MSGKNGKAPETAVVMEELAPAAAPVLELADLRAMLGNLQAQESGASQALQAAQAAVQEAHNHLMMIRGGIQVIEQQIANLEEEGQKWETS